MLTCSRPVGHLSWLFLLLFFHSSSAFAQETDSLAARYHSSSHADERATIAYQILAKNFSSNPSVASTFLLHAIKDSTQVEATNLANCYKGISIIYYYKGLYDSSVFYADRALVLYNRLNLEIEVNKVIKNRALSLTGKGDYSEAINDYLKTLAFEKKNNDTLRITGTLNDIGNAYTRLRNFDEGMKFQREALQYLAHFDNPAIRGNVLNSVGYIYDVGGINRDSAISYYSQSLAIKEKHGNVYSIINTKNNLCACYSMERELGTYLSCFNELLKLQTTISDHTGLVRSNVSLHSAYKKKMNYTRAQAHLNHALKSAELTQDPSLLATVYQSQADLYKQLGQYRQALGAYEKHLVFKDSALYTKRNERTVELAAKYELEKKNREIAEASARLAEGENERLLSTLMIRTRNIWIGGLALLLLLAVMATAVFTQRLRRTKEAEKASAVLAERDKGLKAIIDAQEDERTRIARDLHDGIGNNLLELKMRMQRTDNNGEEVRKSLVTSLNRIMDEVRTVSHEMMPKVLQEFGCVPAIRDLLDRTLGLAGVRYSFETHHTDRRYHSRIETAVYRIIQELINNIIRHSQADMVTVQLIETDGNLVLFVEDNGKGVAADERSDGIGLMSIRTRLNAIKGEIDITDGGGSGTVASIRIPVHEKG